MKLLPILLLLALPAVVQAQFTFTTNNGTITITGYTGSGGVVTIPDTTNGLPVTSIGDGAFYYCTNLTSVTIPTSITNIGDYAFDDCTSLTNVTILDSVTSIGDEAFGYCTNLTRVTMGTNITSIGDYAFYSCTSLTNLTIGNSVTNIGEGAFSLCTSLPAITVATNNPAYSSVAGVLFDKSTNTLIEYPGGKAGSYTIPNSVTNIGDQAFYECTSLTSVTMGTNVTSLGDGAFASTSLTRVTIPNSVTSLGDYVFYGCGSLTNVIIGTNVTSIGQQVFQSCTSLRSITIPNSITNIGDYAFDDCTSLSAITVATNNPAYSSVAGVLFDKSTNTLIEYPGGKAGSYTIPNTVTNIDDYAFDLCTNLISITIPNSVTNLGDGAFYYCTSLTSIYFQGNAPSLGGSYVFDSDTNATGYYLPGTTGWAEFSANTGLPIAELTGIPILAITAPTAGLQVSNANYTITGTAADTVAVTNVFYTLNNSGWTPATTANNWTTWSAPVTLILGTNTIAAYAVDTNGNFSLTNRVSLDYVLNAVLTVRTNGHGTISPNYNGVLLPIGQRYTMTATASPGYGFTGWTGSSTTNAATLTFVMASNLTFTANFVVVTNPTLTITAPSSGQRWSNAVFTVTGIAKDNLQVSNVVCQINGGGWNSATNINNWTNWTAGVTLTPGTNIVQAFAVDTSGNVSTTNSVSFQYVVTNQLGVRAIGLGTISPNDSNAWLNIGQNYSITSAPATGFVFTNWVISTNWIGGTTTSKTNLMFMMASNLTLQASFVETSRPTLTITAPTSGQHMTNALATVVGTAKDNWKVAGIWYQLNNGAWNATATTNGWTNWTTTVELSSGTNTLKAYAMNLGGNFSTTNSVSMVSSNTFKLQLAFTNALPLTTNGLVFSLELSTGLNGHIQVSTNLTSWTTLTNFVGTNSRINFRDPAATNSNHRFYRAVIP
jgi:uncharacterized repeat protein (TIGR02543 family)